jgi:hypothetical protein
MDRCAVILTVNQLRDFVETPLSDASLQIILDAAEWAIVNRAGATGARTEIASGGFRFIALARPAASISSVVETAGWSDSVGASDITLAADDYLVGAGEMLIERLITGTNPRSVWGARVTTVYTPVDDDPIRAEVQIELCKLALNYTPGLAEETIGTWTERFTNNSAWSNQTERDSILERLGIGGRMVVVG